jgi:hypothetical protein
MKNKNIWLLPTDKPSNEYILGKCIKELSDVKIGQFTKTYYLMFDKEYFQPQNIYITSDEEIRDCWGLNNYTNEVYFLKGYYGIQPILKKIILTTDQNLIKDGVQEIDDEFLEWFVKNPSCEKVEVKIWFDTSHISLGIGKVYHSNPNIPLYKIIIPKEEPTIVDKLKEYFNTTSKEQIQKDWEETCKQTEGIISPTVDEFIKAQETFIKQETLEEAAEKYLKYNLTKEALEFAKTICYAFKETKQDDLVEEAILTGIQWQQERSYSEEEVREILYQHTCELYKREPQTLDEFFNKFKKK